MSALFATAVTTAYLAYSSGQLAGLDNVILHPRATVGVTEDLAPSIAPQWHSHLDASAIYGSADTGNGRRSDSFQELRANLRSLYQFYSHDEVLRFSAGLYGEFAFPLQHYVPYYVPTAANDYALEENERIGHESLFGADLNTALDYDRLTSSLDTVVFFSGHRLGPNLLAYSPLLGFDWTNRVYLIGNIAAPKLDLYLNTKFWFARKAGSSILNVHDGVGGTKREIDFTIGLGYTLHGTTRLYLESYGNNNINRGADISKPQGFRDGFVFGLTQRF